MESPFHWNVDFQKQTILWLTIVADSHPTIRKLYYVQMKGVFACSCKNIKIPFALRTNCTNITSIICKSNYLYRKFKYGMILFDVTS